MTVQGASPLPVPYESSSPFSNVGGDNKPDTLKSSPRKLSLSDGTERTIQIVDIENDYTAQSTSQASQHILSNFNETCHLSRSQAEDIGSSRMLRFKRLTTEVPTDDDISNLLVATSLSGPEVTGIPYSIGH